MYINIICIQLKPTTAIWAGMGPVMCGGSTGAMNRCREETALEKKLDRLAGQIGQFGLGAAALSLAAMAVQFTYEHFVEGGERWQWDYLTDYLHFLITSITIVVGSVILGKGFPPLYCLRPEKKKSACVRTTKSELKLLIRRQQYIFYYIVSYQYSIYTVYVIF